MILSFTDTEITQIMGTVSLVQGVCLMLIAGVAIYILHKILNNFF